MVAAYLAYENKRRKKAENRRQQSYNHGGGASDGIAYQHVAASIGIGNMAALAANNRWRRASAAYQPEIAASVAA